MATRVLVTGAGGFIGSHLVEALVREGCDVRAFVRYNSGGRTGNLELIAPEVRSAVEVYFGDLRDAEAVRRSVAGVEAVFHLGAVISVPYSYQHPEETTVVNVGGALNVLTAARDLDVARVVVTSTSEVYGTAQYTPIDERHPVNPQSPYAASKAGADNLAMSFYRTYGLPVAIVRPFNTYGPRQSERAVIPTIIGQALTRDVVELGALHPRRDLTYVADTAAGFLCAWRAGEDALGAPINLGTGVSVSIGELARRIIDLVGRDVPLRSTDARKRPEGSEVLELRADASRARARIGWAPAVSLEEGLRRTIEWARGHLDRFQPDQYRI
ncbi:MAG: SDR family NAD(P)-dependent oxidoreductase [Anaerolineae bacterium]